MTALILVDLQRDFFPGGALGIPSGHEILPAVRELLKQPFDVIVATKDWHPKGHMSFASTYHLKPGENVEQILWPDHCVQNTPGADFAPGWPSEQVEKVILKGTSKDIDSYSTFFDNELKQSTGLEDFLRSRGIHTIVLAGLATDYCVKYSALDALKLGFKVFVVLDGCRGVNCTREDVERALAEMQAAGAILVPHATSLVR